MDSTSGEICPGSVSDGSYSPREATTRGESKNMVFKGGSKDATGVPLTEIRIDADLNSNTSVAGLSSPERQPYPVIGPEDIHRVRISWMLLGLTAALMLLGLLAVVAAAFTGVAAGSILDFLKMSFGYLFPLVMLVIGFYFGRHGKRVSL